MSLLTGRPERGFTLIELMIATSLTAIVMLALGTADATRVRIEQELRERAKINGSEEMRAALAATRLTKSLERADRIVIRNSGGGVAPGVVPGGPANRAVVQLRHVECPGTPDATCLDDPTRYSWEEYRRVGNELEYLYPVTSTCPAPQVFAAEISSFTMQFRNAKPVEPPGGDPFAPDPADNNTVEFALEWDNQLTGLDRRRHEFRQEVTSRNISYTDMNANLAPGNGDSGTGLAPAGISNPPSPCP